MYVTEGLWRTHLQASNEAAHQASVSKRTSQLMSDRKDILIFTALNSHQLT